MALVAIISLVFIFAGTFFKYEKLSVASICIGMIMFLYSVIGVFDHYSTNIEVPEASYKTSIRTDDKTGLEYISNSIFITTDNNATKEDVEEIIITTINLPAEVTDMQHGIHHVIFLCEEKTLDELENICVQLGQVDGITSAFTDIFHRK